MEIHRGILKSFQRFRFRQFFSLISTEDKRTCVENAE